jgi:hypothetical protein
LEYIEKAFEKIGSRLKVGDIAQRNSRFRRIVNRTNGIDAHFVVNIGKDKSGEFFKIDTDGTVEFHIMGVDKNNHHLLLFARDNENAKYRFLCGLDEKGWFAAAVPEAVSNIADAKDALKPAQIIGAQKRLKPKNRNKRKNAAFLRQGEWFFIPAPDIVPDPMLIIKNEPIRRGNGSPHMVEEIYRSGGETVYVCRKHPNGIDASKYQKLIKRQPQARAWGWRLMRRNMAVYGRGRVSHRDHKTIVLKGWYSIVPNRESDAWFIEETLAFLD